MRRRIRQHEVDEKMNMTPLIDCVFLLIMFFILTTEITMKVAAIELPFAMEGKVKDVGEREITQMVEVVIDPEKTANNIRGGSNIMINGEAVDLKQLTAILRKEVEFDWKPPPYGRGRAREQISVGAGKVRELSQLKLLIRADRRSKASYLRTIFTACAAPNVGIYKIELSSEEPRQLESGKAK